MIGGWPRLAGVVLPNGSEPPDRQTGLPMGESASRSGGSISSITSVISSHPWGKVARSNTLTDPKGEPNMAMTDWDDLDQFLGDVPDEDFERPEALDADRANRMLRKLRRLQQWKQNTEATANAEIKRIAEWRDGRSRMMGGEIGRIEAALEGYMRAVNRVDPKVKTQNLPNGSLRLRAPRTRVVIDEPAIAVNFLLHRVAAASVNDTGEAGVPFSTIDEVLDALAAEPMLKVEVKPASGEIGKTADKGMSLGMQSGPLGDSPASNVYSAILPDGEPLPGVALHSFVEDTFTYVLDEVDDPQDGGQTEDEL